MSGEQSGRAVVFGGGGVAGIAWGTGLLLGLAEAGVTLGGADAMIGTSAGAVLAAQLGSGVDLAELYRRQVDPAAQVAELEPDAALYERFLERITALIEAGEGDALIRGMGLLALEAHTVDEASRRSVVAARLAGMDWPERPLTIVAVDASSGETRLFRRDAPLIDAVTASCAVPGVWPPATIGPHRYVDGGIRSMDNADLALGYERALVIAPRGSRLPFIQGHRLLDQLAQLRGAGTRACMIEPDQRSRTAIGRNPLDPTSRIPTAEAGRAQGQGLAAEIAAFWTD